MAEPDTPESASDDAQLPVPVVATTTGTGGAIALSCSLIALVVTLLGLLFLIVLLPRFVE